MVGSNHYNAVFKYNMMASGEVIKKFGKTFRVAALLKECKLGALAKTVEPSNEEIQKVETCPHSWRSSE
jgi:hypothetical protein